MRSAAADAPRSCWLCAYRSLHPNSRKQRLSLHDCAKPALPQLDAACDLQVEWEERWWEASDWAGMREMGAEKAGCRADGAAWRETWREAIAFDPANGEPMVERSAHKWAHDAKVAPVLDMCACSQTATCNWGLRQSRGGTWPFALHACRLMHLRFDRDQYQHIPGPLFSAPAGTCIFQRFFMDY